MNLIYSVDSKRVIELEPRTILCHFNLLDRRRTSISFLLPFPYTQYHFVLGLNRRTASVPSWTMSSTPLDKGIRFATPALPAMFGQGAMCQTHMKPIPSAADETQAMANAVNSILYSGYRWGPSYITILRRTPLFQRMAVAAGVDIDGPYDNLIRVYDWWESFDEFPPTIGLNDYVWSHTRQDNALIS